MTELRIVLAHASAAYEQRVRQAFDGRLNGDLRRVDAAASPSTGPGSLLHQLADSNPDVVALGPDLELEEMFGLAAELERDRPEIDVVLVSRPSGELWERALRAGVRDVLPPDASDAQVREVFERLLTLAERRRQNLVGGSSDDDAGRIVTVLAPKGGSGKTTVASNLALGLAQAEPDSVAIVDLDLQFGDLTAAFRLAPERSLADAALVRGDLDAMTLKSFLTPHPSNLWVLCGPESPAAGEEVSADEAQRLIRALSHEFSFVVVDTAAGLSEHTLAALEVSTDLVFVCTMDVSSVRSLRKEIEALELLGMTHQRRHFVVNRADSKVGLDIRDVEASVGLPVDVAVPSSRLVPLAMNHGSPVLESDPRSPVGRQFGRLVDRFAERPAATASTRLFRRGER
jgi:pilus assembly protein CpaE